MQDEFRTPFANTSIPTFNNFCRTENMNTADLVHSAPEIMKRQGITPDMTWDITELPCSKGMETWSIAAGLLVQGITNFHIRGYDLNDQARAQASRPYFLTKDELQAAFARWDLPSDCADLFETVEPGLMQPIADMRNRATFAPIDVSRQAPEPSHVIITNNLLSHVCRRAEDQVAPIVQNLKDGLVEGGILTCNDSQHLPLAANEIRQVGLQPVRYLSSNKYPEFFQLKTRGLLGFLQKLDSLRGAF